jgi:ATP-dependent DNA helicase DinG
MHQRAQESDIIIVNHHLFFADLALRDETTRAAFCPNTTRRCLTRRTRSREVAGQYFGVSIGNYRIHDLRRDIAVVSRMKKFGTPSSIACCSAWKS